MMLSDIQGLVFHSYKRLPYANYVLVRFGKSPDVVRSWLRTLVDRERIDNALPKETGPVGSPFVRLNIAFTYTGLVALALPADALDTFPFEFTEGLGVPWAEARQPDHRSRILGDVDGSAPAVWTWGYRDQERT